MSRSIWIDAGNDPNKPKLDAAKIDTPYFDVRDPKVTGSYLDGVKAKFDGVGLYLCSQGEDHLGPWPSAKKLSGPEWATWAYQTVQRICGDRKWVKVCLNCETHDANWIVSMLKKWRSHSPRRETSWALEGHQGGLFSPSHIAAINATEVLVVPEFFRGAMQAQSPGVVLELLRSGFAPGRLSGFYDAAVLPYNWGAGDVAAFAFTQGRLP